MACYNENDPYNKALADFVGEEVARRHVEDNGGHPLNLDRDGNPDKFFDDIVRLTGKTHAGFMAKMEGGKDLLSSLESINKKDRSVVFDIYEVMKEEGKSKVDAKLYANYRIRDKVDVINKLKKYLPELKETDNFEDIIREKPLDPAYEVMRQQRAKNNIVDDVRINNYYSDKFKC